MESYVRQKKVSLRSMATFQSTWPNSAGYEKPQNLETENFIQFLNVIWRIGRLKVCGWVGRAFGKINNEETSTRNKMEAENNKQWQKGNYIRFFFQDQRNTFPTSSDKT